MVKKSAKTMDSNQWERLQKQYMFQNAACALSVSLLQNSEVF